MAELRNQFQAHAAKPEDRLNHRLTAAVWKGRLTEIHNLVSRGADPDARRGPQDRTLLMRACEQGDVATVRVLISNGARAEVTDNDMDTCLHIAAAGDKPELIPILVTKGANTETRNRAHYTPLMVAAAAGKTEIIEKLLEYGANPNAATKTGLSALHLATRAGHADTVALLLKHGVDPQAETRKKITPLHIAKRINDPNVMEAYISHFSFKHSKKVYLLHQKRAKMLAHA